MNVISCEPQFICTNVVKLVECLPEMYRYICLGGFKYQVSATCLFIVG